jgi:uncharacterized membrane protein YedE/YeeE
MFEFFIQPWPWYVAGPLLGLTVPALLLLGNKSLGISSSLRHVCAACFPAGIRFFTYDWKKEIWNLTFVAGIALGAWLTVSFFANPEPPVLGEKTRQMLVSYGLDTPTGLQPAELFGAVNIFSLSGLIFLVFGGFLVGFGTRYAGGCTSGHTIMGLSNLQWPSLVATAAFMTGGLLATHFILPFVFNFLNR